MQPSTNENSSDDEIVKILRYEERLNTEENGSYSETFTDCDEASPDISTDPGAQIWVTIYRIPARTRMTVQHQVQAEHRIPLEMLT